MGRLSRSVNESKTSLRLAEENSREAGRPASDVKLDRRAEDRQ